jgi:hypothetical protein
MKAAVSWLGLSASVTTPPTSRPCVHAAAGTRPSAGPVDDII